MPSAEYGESQSCPPPRAQLQPESRAAWQRLLAQGWADAIHTLDAPAPMYTFSGTTWSALNNPFSARHLRPC